MKNQLPYSTMVVTANPESSTDVSHPQKSIFVTTQMDTPVVKLPEFDSQSPHSKMVPQHNVVTKLSLKSSLCRCKLSNCK